MASPEEGPETFVKAQIAVSEVLNQKRFNTVISCAFVACTKRELEASPKQVKDRSCGKKSLKTSKKISF